MLDGSEYFDCACHSFDHSLRFVLDLDKNVKDDEMSFPTIYTEIALGTYLPWYKRIVLSVKYVFGFEIQHAYNCWEINTESDDPDRMIAMLQKLKDALVAEEEKRVRLYQKNNAEK
jgi:hypothetical protein